MDFIKVLFSLRGANFFLKELKLPKELTYSYVSAFYPTTAD